MAEVVAIRALRAADAEMRADAPVDRLHPLRIVFADRKPAQDQKAGAVPDRRQYRGEVFVERRMREMMPPELMKRQGSKFTPRHQLVDRGEMRRGEIPVERIAVEFGAAPAIAMA